MSAFLQNTPKQKMKYPRIFPKIPGFYRTAEDGNGARVIDFILVISLYWISLDGFGRGPGGQ